ncbi:uncharacterized protein LOC143301439 [Babylonia areolata]|uniref:uncharacterized protein LOC143301439 n=1 Tax=Babylonia areolata TaxID=304850 RepID=UPI003FD2E03B
MDTAKIEAWLLNEKDTQDPVMRVAAAYPATCLRRPRPGDHPLSSATTSSSAATPGCPDRDWTNPNRFSDPLNRSSSSSSSRFPSALGLSLPGRPNKAYTWYLENELPWRLRAARVRAVGEDTASSSAHSLFGTAPHLHPHPHPHTRGKVGDVGEVEVEVDAGKRKRRNGASFTWERVRGQGHHHHHHHHQRGILAGTAIPQRYNTLDHPRPTTRASGRLSPHTAALNKRGSSSSCAVSPSRAWNRCVSPVNSSSYGVRHLNSPRTSPARSGGKRSSPSPSRHGLGNHHHHHHHHHHLTSRHTSPASRGSSQRSSPNRSPQGTMARLSPGCGVVRQYSGQANNPLRLSPTPQHSVLAPSFRGGAHYGPSSPVTVSRSSFVAQWVNNSSPSLRLSPFSARSSHTSSGREDGDVSVGSETDDDFFYVSCKQLSQGLADLSVTGATQPHGGGGNCLVVENPTFVLPPQGDDNVNDDDDDDFIGCSDDALSDDVFLEDNPQPTVASSKRYSLSQNASLERAHTDANAAEPRPAADQDAEYSGLNGVDHPALQSLRRNSLQSRLRQTWQHRRNKAAGGRSLKLRRTPDNAITTGATTSDAASAAAASESPCSPCPDSPSVQNTNPAADSAPEDGNTPGEAKPCFYYVISPTDDVNMPDVIAVRRSSVELIRWQNSLRRRRRRQAKRHDLGRNKKKEPKQSATV